MVIKNAQAQAFGFATNDEINNIKSEDIIGIDGDVEVSIDTIPSTDLDVGQESKSVEEIENDIKELPEEALGLRPLFWTVFLVVVVALSGGGLVLLRNRN